MSNKIFKYELVHETSVVALPVDSLILTVEEQYNKVVMYVQVDDSNETVERYFELIPTGFTIENVKDLIYIGTVKLEGGSYVLHVCERTLPF